MLLSDEALRERLLQGDLGAFDQLYARHGRALYAFIYRHLGDAAASEDVLHETFMVMLRERDGGRAAESLRAWLYQVARNQCINRLVQICIGHHHQVVFSTTQSLNAFDL